MIAPDPHVRWGDPASVSALAAELRRAAEDLESARSVVLPGHLPELPGLGRPEVVDRLGVRAHRMATGAEALRVAATALQQYASDVQQARGLHRLGEDAVTRATDAAALHEATCLGEAARDDAAEAARRLTGRLAAAVGALQG